MTGVPSPEFTRYKVEANGQETRRERAYDLVLWMVIAVACVVIVVFAYLLISGG